MINILIIDDEPLARSLIKEYLEGKENIQNIEECGDGFEGLKSIQSNPPDLIFLDIQMPKISGFEMLELLDEPPPIIFTTAYDEFALKAFEANALDYLLKPFSKERFDLAFEKGLAAIKQRANTSNQVEIKNTEISRPEENHRIVVKTNAGIKIIPVNEIMYLEAYDDYVKVYTKEQMYLKKKTLTFYENALASYDFIRVHRSYLVSLNYITRIEQTQKETYVAVLKNDSRIPLSRSGYQVLKSKIGL